MPELQAGVRFGGAATRFYLDHPTLVVSVVLSLVGIATGMTAAMSVVQGFALLDLGVLAAGVVLAAGLCFLHVRHLALAILTAAAPLPGLVWAAPLSGGASFGALPVLAYGFGYAVAALVAQQRIAREIADGAAQPPWRTACTAIGLMAILAVLWFGRSALADTALQAVADTALSVLSVAIVLPLATLLLHFDESFVARANRSQEHRVRIFERVALVTIPRWGFSFTGIAIVFLALGWFGAEPVLRDGLWLRLGSLLLVGAAGGLLAGGWREGFAIALICTVVCLMSLWAMAVDSHTSGVDVLQIVTLGLFLALYGERRSLAWRRADTPPVVAQRRALEQGCSQTLAGGGTVIALFPALVIWPGSPALAISGLVAIVAATISVPAAVTAFEVLTPRRRSVEDLYGPRKRPVHP